MGCKRDDVRTVNAPPATRPRWPWLSLLPLGAGAWAPIYAGIKAQTRSWVALGVAWSAVTIAGWIAAGASHSHHNSFAGILILLGWVGAIATSFAIRSEYERRIGSPLLAATEQAQSRLDERRRALTLARENPVLAAEVGVGRPDRPGAQDAGLVDINNAGLTALLRLPGVDDGLATKIVETRAECGGFSSVEDFGATVDLPGDVVEGLRERVVFLPRQA
jgi:DNA uptake protein ComE-like DNA-binding protein